MTRVIAIGTRHGEDAIALELTADLAPELARLDPGIEVIGCDRPGTELLQRLDVARPNLLIDAVVGADKPGSVIEVSLDQLDGLENPLSTHDLSVCETLRLAQALGDLPRRLWIFGICVDPARPLGAERKRAAAAELLARIAARIRAAD